MSDVDINNIVTDLNNKADKDLINTEPSDAFKQQVLSWVSSGGSIGSALPDYTAGIEISESMFPYTAPSNGICFVHTGHVSTTGARYVTVNGIAVGHFNSQYATLSNITVPVNTGDIVDTSAGWSSAGGYFFPLKGEN